MKGLRRLAATLLAALVAMGSAACPVHASTANIGAVSEISDGALPNPITAAGGDALYVVQIGESAGTYAVPAGYGVVTAWRHATGGTAGDLTFKVYRPTGTPGEFLVIAADPRTAVPGTVHTFPARIPVKPGDRVGISTTQVEVAYSTANDADRMGVFTFDSPDPPAGSMASLDGLPFQQFKVDVSARIETDADKDGFGDDTQDGCRTNGTTQGPCPRAYYLPPSGSTTPTFFEGCPSSAVSVLKGTPAADSITGTARGDRIFTGTGDDTVDGRAGGDCLDLGPGVDRGEGGPGADLERGGVGADRLSGGADADRLLGGPDADNLLGGAGNDSLFGDAGNDRLSGSSGNDRMYGVSGNDRVSGGAGKDRISGGAGKDVISGGGSADTVAGDQGNDRLKGDSGNDTLKGNSGADRLSGGSGRDRLSGGTGDDRISARDGKRDRIFCGRGRDTVVADAFDLIARDCERVR